jgi:hypothetical protein
VPGAVGLDDLFFDLENPKSRPWGHGERRFTDLLEDDMWPYVLWCLWISKNRSNLNAERAIAIANFRRFANDCSNSAGRPSDHDLR